MWDEIPPMDRNGNISMYEIFYNPQDNFEGAIGANSTTVSGSETTVTIKGLEESVTYNISVRAYTSSGAGPFSDDISVTTLEDGEKFYYYYYYSTVLWYLVNDD